MKNGFTFELYEMTFTNCFIQSSNYANGDLKLSLFGKDPDIHKTTHFADITLEQNSRKLKDGEIVVNCKFKPTLIPQLLNLGIIKEQTGLCIVGDSIYPVYTIDLTQVKKNHYCIKELIAA